MMTAIRLEADLPMSQGRYALNLSADSQGLQVNVVDDGCVVNRVVIELADGQPILKVWTPKEWADIQPGLELPLTEI